MTNPGQDLASGIRLIITLSPWFQDLLAMAWSPQPVNVRSLASVLGLIVFSAACLGRGRADWNKKMGSFFAAIEGHPRFGISKWLQGTQRCELSDATANDELRAILLSPKYDDELLLASQQEWVLLHML